MLLGLLVKVLLQLREFHKSRLLVINVPAPSLLTDLDIRRVDLRALVQFSARDLLATISLRGADHLRLKF